MTRLRTKVLGTNIWTDTMGVANPPRRECPLGCCETCSATQRLQFLEMGISHGVNFCMAIRSHLGRKRKNGPVWFGRLLGHVPARRLDRPPSKHVDVR